MRTGGLTTSKSSLLTTGSKATTGLGRAEPTTSSLTSKAAACRKTREAKYSPDQKKKAEFRQIKSKDAIKSKLKRSL